MARGRQVAFAVVVRLALAAKVPATFVLDGAENSVKWWGKPMKLVSTGEPE
jgi:hypothetical protein